MSSLYEIQEENSTEESEYYNLRGTILFQTRIDDSGIVELYSSGRGDGDDYTAVEAVYEEIRDDHPSQGTQTEKMGRDPDIPADTFKSKRSGVFLHFVELLCIVGIVCMISYLVVIERRPKKSSCYMIGGVVLDNDDALEDVQNYIKRLQVCRRSLLRNERYLETVQRHMESLRQIYDRISRYACVCSYPSEKDNKTMNYEDTSLDYKGYP